MLSKKDLMEMRKQLDSELARGNIKSDRKLAIAQELQSINVCLKEK